MQGKTVGKRIFMSSVMTVLVTFAIVLLVNLLVIKGWWDEIEAEEEQWQLSLEQIAEGEQLAEETEFTSMIEDWTIHRRGFYVALAWDAAFCAVTLVIVSAVFTRGLIRHVKEPLNVLGQGIRRIGERDLTTPVEYYGDREFEEVCEAFNQMQAHILKEQEKNRRYEKARTDMIAGISHDLRTPLTAVRGTIKGLLDGVVSSPEQQKRFLRVAYVRTGDMERLLGQLFVLSRLETGNLSLNLYRIGLAAFLEQYAAEKGEFLQPGEEELTVRLPGKEIHVNADPEQLHRILDNLFENSRKYAGRRPLLMELFLSRGEGGAEVIFSDNGDGVLPEQLPYVFDEFYRGDESRNKKSGNGLGLYIVKYLAEAMGGRVWAESKDGFSVHLAFRESEE